MAQVGISGSTVLEDQVVLAGQAGVAGHLRIGTGARIGAQAGVMADVPPRSEMVGAPAQPVEGVLQGSRDDPALGPRRRRPGRRHRTREAEPRRGLNIMDAD